jgi:putative PIN family toxin of toxin-antitoxin system
MRAVLDANALISGLLWRGNPHRCLLAAEAGLYELVLAKAILQEVKEKLVEKFGNTLEEAEESLAGLRRRAVLVPLTGRTGWVLADPDDKVVEAALAGAAEVIVSGDHHLRDLGTIEGIPVLSPRQFLDRFASQG